MKKLTLVLLFFSSVSFALSEYYALSRSIRAMGMGGAFYGLSDDEYALFYNPAGLSFYRRDWQVKLPINAGIGTQAISQFSTLKNTFENANDIPSVVTSLDPLRGKPFSMQLGLMPFYVQKNFAIALLLGETKANFGIDGVGVDTLVKMTAISDSGLVAGYGREVYKNLHVGANVKAIFRAGGKRTYTTLDIANSTEFDTNLEDIGGVGGGVDLDIGAMYELQKGYLPYTIGHRIGLTFTNLLATSFNIAKSGNAPQLPRYVSLGTATMFKSFGFLGNVTLLLDFAEFQLGGQSDPELGARTGSFWKHINWGLEVPLGTMFAVRTGFHQGNLTAGLGINLKYLKFDFLYYGAERGKSIATNTEHRLAFRLSMGLGALYPKAITQNSIYDYNKAKLEMYEARKEVEINPSKLGKDNKGKATDLGKELEKGKGQDVNATKGKTSAEHEAEAKAEEAAKKKAEEEKVDLSTPN